MLRLKGVLPAVLTPLTAAMDIDAKLLVRHVEALRAQGADGAVLFGTTGEAASFTVAERQKALEQVVKEIAPKTLLVGTGCCAGPDTLALTRHAVELGCAGVLVMPPFFYKTVSDEGLYRTHADLIEGVGRAFHLYLYHFPQMSMMPLSHRLVERLTVAFPEVVAGLKDSSGSLDNMLTMAKDFPSLDIFSGSDRHFASLRKAGGAGCITAIANVITPLLAEIKDDPGDEEVQDVIERIREDFEGRPLTASLKALVALLSGEDGWRRVRPPLTPVEPADAVTLRRAIEGTGYRLPEFA